MSEAVFGFIGVLVGAAIPWLKEEWHRCRSRSENGKLLAVRVIGILDEFAEKCVEVAGDNGEEMGRPSHREADGQEYCYPVATTPDAPHFSNDIDWRSTDDKLMFRAHMIAGKLRALDNYLGHLWSEVASPPDYSEFFEPRQEAFAKLGLEAMDIAAKLRRYHKLPDKEPVLWNEEWNAETFLTERLAKIAEIRDGRRRNMIENGFILSDEVHETGQVKT